MGVLSMVTTIVLEIPKVMKAKLLPCYTSKRITRRNLGAGRYVGGLVGVIPWAIGLISWLVRKCKLPSFDQSCDDCVHMTSSELFAYYGFVRLTFMLLRLHLVLIARSIGRFLGTFLGCRSSAPYMYNLSNTRVQQDHQPILKVDRPCIRFNLNWKIQYIKDKIVMPLINVSLVSGGIWGENQWEEFAIEPRANECYKDEHSGEVKQLQTMALHGKIVSLFWLCIPNAVSVAYAAEVLNRGPILAYFINKKFLQADILESERDKDPV